MSTPKTKVLYLAGWGRSGSTILSNIIGEVEGFFSAGEVYNLWQRGLLENKLCGCERSFSECVFWKETFELAYGGIDSLDVKHMLKIHDSVHNADLMIGYLPGG